jgi:hypothetical protein
MENQITREWAEYLRIEQRVRNEQGALNFDHQSVPPSEGYRVIERRLRARVQAA